MDMIIPKDIYIEHDPRPYYRFVSEKAVALIKQPSFSVLELCPGPNFNPMNFFSSAAGARLSSYTVVELVQNTCKFLEKYKGSGKIHVINRSIKHEIKDILEGRHSYDMLLLSGLVQNTFERVLNKLNGRLTYFLLYAQDVSFVSDILKGYDLTFFHYQRKAPSAVFASLK